MTALTIAPADGSGPGETCTDPETISAKLQGIGVQFERWEAGHELAAEADQQDVLEAYSDSIEKLNKRYGFKSVDVVGLNPDHPDAAGMRGKFLQEHTHADFEVRFFVTGSGLFYLHVGDLVYMMLCESGDLISVPANTTHWFDMGSRPFFRCIRFFTSPDGWVGKFTGSDIAARFPDFDSYISGLA